MELWGLLLFYSLLFLRSCCSGPCRCVDLGDGFVSCAQMRVIALDRPVHDFSPAFLTGNKPQIDTKSNACESKYI
jgi:hypothetical protein